MKAMEAEATVVVAPAAVTKVEVASVEVEATAVAAPAVSTSVSSKHDIASTVF